ncbi:MAG TPA: GAF domain-containing protein [Polyangiaceae bacterium]|nr:GAF domain-containing protein [Polyangiaceae bacterium]
MSHQVPALVPPVTRPPLVESRTSGESEASAILMVDDHPHNLIALEAALDPLGKRLERASSGAEALALLRTRDFAVALLDVRMPDLDGLEVLARLRKESIATPVIFLTAAEEATEEQRRGYDRGAVDFLSKPLDARVLRSKVRVFVELHEKRRELERLSKAVADDRLLARERAQHLARSGAQLAQLLSSAEVARLVENDVRDQLRALLARLYLSPEYAVPARAEPSSSPPLEWAALVTRATKQSEPLWLESRPQLEALGLAGALGSGVESAAVLPLSVGGHCLGALLLGFDGARAWDSAEREFLLTLAVQIAGALERARLLERERSAHEELRRRTDAARLTADFSTLLSSSLDHNVVLRQLSELIVPAIADWCAIDLVQRDGSVGRVTTYHRDPQRLALALELEQRYPNDPDATTGVPQVLRSGETEWMHEIPGQLLEAAARDPEHLRLIQGLGLASYVVVPLRARGRTLGALSLVYAESGRRYSADDVAFIEELARRASLSVDNALLFQEQVEARQAQERNSRHALLVGDIGVALSQSDAAQVALQHCAEALVQRLDACLARIWTRDSRDHALQLQASAGMYQLDGAHAHGPIGQLELERIVHTGKAQLINDIQQDASFSDAEWARREGIVAFAGCPLLIAGHVIGIMTLFARVPVAEDTFATVASMAHPIAVGIERTEAARRAKEERDTLEIVNQVGLALAGELQQDKLVRAVTDYATRLAGAAFGAFFYKDTAGNADSAVACSVSGAPREAFQALAAACDPERFTAVIAAQGVVRVDDLRSEAKYEQAPPHHGLLPAQLPLVSYLAVPVRSSNHRVIGALFFGHPAAGVFTERSELLVAGVAAQAGTAMDNARLFREAQRLISELDKSNRDLDQFAYVASHDLKAPLRGISNLSQWLEEDLGDAITPEGKEQLQLLRGRVQRMEGLINGILDYSRAGRKRSKVESISVQRLLADVVELCSPPPEARIEIAAGMPELRSERIPLQQVFSNLIGNALKHAKRSDPHVTVTVRDLGERYEFAVSDNGRGIAPEFHERIWGIFQTLEPRDSVESTGIGLSVVKKIVESKGGSAWVESREGQGATFRFTWPKLEQETVNNG